MTDKPAKRAAGGRREPLHAEPPSEGGGSRKPNPEPDWQEGAPLFALTRKAIVERLVDLGGESRDRAAQYADLFLEYREATNNIGRYGVVAFNGANRQPMENPYMNRRDKARTALERFRDIEAPWLWQLLEAEDVQPLRPHPPA